MKKLLLPLTTGILLTVINSKPANAFPINIDITKTIENFFNEVGLNNQLIDSYLDRITTVFSPAIDAQAQNNKGQLNLPDLNQTEEGIANALEASKELEDLAAAQNLLSIGVVQSHAQSITGETGQENAIENREDVAEAVEDLAEFAENARNAVVTQDVMKEIAQQNARLGDILAKSYSTNEDIRITNAYSNQINSKLLQQQIIDREERTKQEANRGLIQSAFMGEFTRYVLGEE